nr:hypothetical protein [Geodermatophilaceae bacterium]
MSDPSVANPAPQPTPVLVPDTAQAHPLAQPAAAPAARGLVTGASYSITVRLTADGDPASIG